MTEEKEQVSLATRIENMPVRYLACRDYSSHAWKWPPSWSLNDDETITRRTVCLTCGMRKEQSYDRRTAEKVGSPRYIPDAPTYYLKGYGRVDAGTFRSVLIERAMSRIQQRRKA